MKKILSFLLVLCMLLSIVPATMLTVFAEEGETTLPSSTLDRDAVTFTEDWQVVLPDGWSLVGRESGNFDNWMELTTLWNFNEGVPGNGGEGGVIMVEGDTDINSSYPLFPWFNHYERPDFWGAWFGIGPKAGWNAGYSYTAPNTGYIDVDINKIVYDNLAVVNGWTNTVKYVAVFVNGQMVWPTAGGSYDNTKDWAKAENVLAKTENDAENTYTGELMNADLLKNIFVGQGDKVEFLAKSNENASAVYAGLTVSYTSILQDVALDASVALGEKFSIAFNVTADPTATEKGIYVNGQKQPDGYVIEDLVAAELGTATFLYAPYQVVAGKEIKAETQSITALDILAQYTAENGYDEKTVALAEATILYASMAEAYFEEFDLDEELKAIVDAMAAPEAKNAKITDAIDETATFTYAKIYLNDSMDMKFFFKAENATELNAKVEGAGDATVTVEEVPSGYAVLIEDLPMSAYGTDLKVTVYDGETAISETLTYSVEIYAARMYEADATGIDQLALNDLLKTIVNLGKAAAAYNA